MHASNRHKWAVKPKATKYLGDELFSLQLRHLASLETEAAALFLFSHGHPAFLVVDALDTPKKKRSHRNEDMRRRVAVVVSAAVDRKKIPRQFERQRIQNI